MDFSAAINPVSAYHKLSAKSGSSFPADAPVLTAKVKLLWHCNLSCRFCKLPAKKAIMSRDTARDLARQLYDHGLRKVHFSGGEVLIHPDCFDIFADWSALGIQVNITSNGFLMGKHEVRRLEEAGVHSVSLSIDAAARELHDSLRGVSGSHKAVTRAATRLAERGKIKLRINTVVTAFNCAMLDDMRPFMQSLGPKTVWKLIPVDSSDPSVLPDMPALRRCSAMVAHWPELEDRTPFGATEEDFRNVSQGRNGFLNRPCFAPWFHLFFSPDGSCHPCCMARGSAPVLGNFPGQTVEQILAGQAMRALRSSFASGRYLPCCARCDDFRQENLAIEKLGSALP